MNKQTLRDVDVAGKRVLVRVDFNVPLDREGHVTDATRIREALPTIKYLRERGARLGDLYVNDAFGTAHRAHASTEGVTHYLPAVAGLLMERELEAFARILEHPERPLAAIIGGAKVSSKIGVLEHLLGKVDRLLI